MDSVSVQLRSFSFRFAEQVFNSRLQLKQEISYDRRLSRRLEKALEGLFTGWHLKMH